MNSGAEILLVPSTLGQSRPVFPHFKPLDITDRKEIEAFTSKFEPYSDFCFSTLVFYNGNGQTRWCWLNDNLVLHLQDGFGPGAYFTFLGHNQVDITADILIDYALEIHCSPVLRLVPEIAAHAVTRTNRFFITAERDCFDYVYNLHSLFRMEGSTFSGIRRDVTRFKRRYPHHYFVLLDLVCAKTNSELLSSFSVWQLQKNQAETLKSYCSALDKCLSSSKTFDLLGIGIMIDNSLAGFSICDRIDNDWILSHFAAADANYTGLSGALLHHIAEEGMGLGCTYLNYQEDLGDSGLRRFKMKCAPAGFLKKYSVSRADISAGQIN